MTRCTINKQMLVVFFFFLRTDFFFSGQKLREKRWRIGARGFFFFFRFVWLESTTSPSCTNCSSPVLRHCRPRPFRTSLFQFPFVFVPLFSLCLSLSASLPSTCVLPSPRAGRQSSHAFWSTGSPSSFHFCSHCGCLVYVVLLLHNKKNLEAALNFV